MLDNNSNGQDIDVDSDSSKRSHHNALERKRRDHIKESFNGLRDSVPSLQGEKASRAQILNKATEYIQDMTRKNTCHKDDIEELRRQNTELEMKIRALERAKREGILGDGQIGNEVSEQMMINSDQANS